VGNSISPEGLTKTFVSTLASLDIPSSGLYVEDGSGLSKANRVSPRTVVSLLSKIRNNPIFQSIYDGLPVGGVSGTLANRFTTAPQAIGHVHAKTGFLSSVVKSMAGYVDDGENEYVFVIIVDGIRPRLSARKAAREVMDQMLESIVKGNRQTP
jgi:PBP4 family serine-type D-alanyl-D-alanine carboxypeptidase